MTVEVGGDGAGRISIGDQACRTVDCNHGSATMNVSSSELIHLSHTVMVHHRGSSVLQAGHNSKSIYLHSSSGPGYFARSGPQKGPELRPLLMET